MKDQTIEALVLHEHSSTPWMQSVIAATHLCSGVRVCDGASSIRVPDVNFDCCFMRKNSVILSTFRLRTSRQWSEMVALMGGDGDDGPAARHPIMSNFGRGQRVEADEERLRLRASRRCSAMVASMVGDGDDGLAVRHPITSIFSRRQRGGRSSVAVDDDTSIALHSAAVVGM
ncbi:hypothetical protein R6Q57_022189 [Mikania cordata]